MTWHWSHRTLPELAELPDHEKLRVWRVCAKRVVSRPATWARAAGLLAGVFVTVGSLVYVAARAGLRAPWMLVPIVASYLLAFGTSAHLLIGWIRNEVRRSVPGRCRACGYDLTGNASGRCPGCGVEAAGGPGRPRDARDGR